MVRSFVITIAASAFLAGPAIAQIERGEIDPDDPAPGIILPPPDIPPDILENIPEEGLAPDVTLPDAPTPEVEAPDYSRLSSKEEREARLSALFDRLADAEESDRGNLIAEEIWALWLDSGSASVNFVLRRGADAQVNNNRDMARTMFNHVTELEPDYAEGWARSARLALEERDFARTVSESVRALTLEPRHFYALWTLGNVMEQLGRQEEALEAYREANRLYPSLEEVKDRVEALELQLGGGVL